MTEAQRAAELMRSRLELTEQFQVAAPGRPPVWVDGLDVARAAIIEIVPVGDPESWILTPGRGLPSAVVEAARTALDTRLLRLAEVLADTDNPLLALHLYTDHDCAVEVLADAVARTSLARHSLITVMTLDG